MTERDLEILRQIASGKSFNRADDSEVGIATFNVLADRLFELEGQGLITIPPGRIMRDHQRANGGFIALAPKLTGRGEAELSKAGR